MRGKKFPFGPICTAYPQAVDGFSTGSWESTGQLLKLHLQSKDQSKVHSKSNLQPRDRPEKTLKSHRSLVDNPVDKLWITCGKPVENPSSYPQAKPPVDKCQVIHRLSTGRVPVIHRVVHRQFTVVDGLEGTYPHYPQALLLLLLVLLFKG